MVVDFFLQNQSYFLWIGGIVLGGFLLHRFTRIPSVFKMIFDKTLLRPIGVQVIYLFLATAFTLVLFIIIGRSSGVNYGSSTYNQMQKIESLLSGEEKTQEPSLSDEIVYIFSRLIDPGSINDSEAPAYASFITIIGWVLCSGFLIAIITNGYFERIKKIESGLTRYKLTDHVVIIGSNPVYIHLIKLIRSGELTGYNTVSPNCKIVLFSSRKSEKLREHMQAFLNKKEEKNVLVFRGIRTSDDHLASLGLEDSKAIFVLGETSDLGCDSMNIICVERIAAYLSKEGEKDNAQKIPCRLLLNDLFTFNLLNENELSLPKNYLKLSTFNNHDSWSSIIFSSDSVFAEPLKERTAAMLKLRNDEASNVSAKTVMRFVIIGFNRMGMSLADQAARVMHFGEDRKVIVTVIDPDCANLEIKYRNQRHSLDQIPDVGFEFYTENAESIDVAKKIHDWHTQNQLLGIAICFSNSTDSLFHASLILKNLTRSLENNTLPRVPIYVRQPDRSDDAQILHHQERSAGAIVSYGMYNKAVYDTERRDQRAQKVHENYLRMNAVLFGASSDENPNVTPWKYLNNSMKASNSFVVEATQMKSILIHAFAANYGVAVTDIDEFRKDARALLYVDILKNGNSYNYKLKPDEVEAIKVRAEKYFSANANHNIHLIAYEKRLKAFSEKDKKQLVAFMEFLAEIEHNRWMAERIISGWVEGSRDDYRKVHPNICAYNKLDEITKMYDRGGFV